MNLEDVLDFEGVLEKAIGQMFEAQDVACYTPQWHPKFTRDRPRIDAIVQIGAGVGRYEIVPGVPMERENCIETAWSATLSMDVISDMAPELHTAFRIKVRAIALLMPLRINGAYLTLHNMWWPIQDQGCGQLMVAPQKGWRKTNMRFGFKFSLQANALEVFTNEINST